MRKYAGVGNGQLIPHSKLVPNKSSVRVIEEGGHLEAANAWVILEGTLRDIIQKSNSNEGKSRKTVIADSEEIDVNEVGSQAK